VHDFIALKANDKERLWQKSRALFSVYWMRDRAIAFMPIEASDRAVGRVPGKFRDFFLAF